MREDGLTYEVPGADILDRMKARALLAEAVVKELGAEEKANACNAGIVKQAEEDARALRLSAKYLDRNKTYTLAPATLHEIFLTTAHYVDQVRGLGPAREAQAERTW